MADVFISYSRKDTDFVRKLDDALELENRDVWVDWMDIARGEDWWRSIETGIDSADTALIVVTQHWLVSEICQRELEYVRQQNKRVFPIIRQKIEGDVAIYVKGTWVDQEWEQRARDNWKYIRSLNWLFFDDDTTFDAVFKDLLTALDTDQLHIKSHTRYLVRALEWQQFNRNPSFLLEGDQLQSARAWLDTSANKHPEPHPAHHEYIGASKLAESVRIARDRAREQLIRRFRQAAIALGILVVIALVVAGVVGQQFIVARADVTRAGATLQQVNLQVTAAINQQSTAVAQVQAAEALVATATIEQGNAVVAQQTSAARESAASTQVAVAGSTLSPVPPTLTAVASAILDAYIQQDIASEISNASIQLVDNNSDGALETMDNVVDTYPDESLAYVGRGLMLDSLNRLDEAMADYTKAIALDPENVGAYINRGGIYRRQGDLDKALADFTTSIELDPSYTIAYGNRADTYSERGDYDKALADYNKIIELEPDSELAYLTRGLFYQINGYYDEAFSDYQQALKLDPNSVDAHSGMGDIYANNQQYEQALAEYNRAIELNSQNAAVYFTRGTVYGLQQQFDKAIADYQAAIDLDPKYTEAYYNLGDMYYYQGELDSALQAFDETLRIDPEYAYAYHDRASVYAQMDEPEKASADYLQWITLNQTAEDSAKTVTQAQVPYETSLTMTEGSVYKISFEGRAGQLLQASAAAAKPDDEDVDALLVLLNPQGKPVMFANDTDESKDAYLSDYELPEDGLYTLFLSYSAGGSEGDLDVTLDLQASAEATPAPTAAS